MSGVIASPYRGLAASARGFSHRADGRPCQDASGVKLLRGYALAAAADGHGGEKYRHSGVGSRLAVDCALAELAAFLQVARDRLPRLSEKKETAAQRHLAGRIIAAWREKTARHFAALREQGLERGEYEAFLYGTTLLYAALTPDCCLVSQIGDGRAVTLGEDGAADFPVPEDARLGFGLTTSLCDERAIDNFRHCFLAEPRLAVFLATDGTADSYTPESLAKFAAALVANHGAKPAQTRRRLENWLPELSEKGSRDDASVAVIYRKSRRRRTPWAFSL